MPTIDLTPDTKVLIALTRTPLRPIDALCELIDNAIDSFEVAVHQGSPIKFPVISVELPGGAEVGRGEGVVRIRDNGPGMSVELAEKALRAGYSGKDNPYDSLGLFGMGFNIATGKMGRRSRMVTAQPQGERAVETVVDLVDIRDAGSFEVDADLIGKPENLGHGTLIEVSGWWPEGDPNVGFIKKLAGYSKPRVRDEIGRIYATVLRERDIQIVVNGEPCQPFEHCAWSSTRYVERQNHGRIPARFEFDHSVGSQRRCTTCNALGDPDSELCPACGSASFRTIDERIRGWLGVQRFDDMTHYGVDLIRNGRAIRVFEKAAFFEFTDELRETVKDYPIDSQYGRLVGEVHLNHVPVDFLKQDFQRSSPEWQNAMRYLRGDSSLQPNRPNADSNQSPMFKLYQGYRRVRTPGTRDLYMGYNDGKPRRVAREVEQDYFARFKRKEPGYRDDSEWWKRVLEADVPPAPELTKCPECESQNVAEAEECVACGLVLRSKTCVNSDCEQAIPVSAESCPTCGHSQVPEFDVPWTCEVCSLSNPAEVSACGECGYPIGNPNLGSREWLADHGDLAEELSIAGLTVELANGAHSQPVDVAVYSVRGDIRPVWSRPTAACRVFKSVEKLEIFLDLDHSLFASLGVKPEAVVGAEAAQYIQDTYAALASGPTGALHALGNLINSVLEESWADRLEDSPERVRDDIHAFLDEIRQMLPAVLEARSTDLLAELTESDQRALLDNLIEAGVEIQQVTGMRTSPGWLQFIAPPTLVRLFRAAPAEFFDGNVWDVEYASLSDLKEFPADAIDELRASLEARYANCLEDIAAYLRFGRPEAVLTARARGSLEFLRAKAVS